MSSKKKKKKKKPKQSHATLSCIFLNKTKTNKDEKIFT